MPGPETHPFGPGGGELNPFGPGEFGQPSESREKEPRATVTAPAEVHNIHRLKPIPTRPTGPEGEWQGGVPGANQPGGMEPTMPPRATVAGPGAGGLEATLTFEIPREWSQEMGARREPAGSVNPNDPRASQLGLYTLGSWETLNLPLREWNRRYRVNESRIEHNTTEHLNWLETRARWTAINEEQRLREHERQQSGYYERLERWLSQPVPVEPGWSVSPIIGNGQFGLNFGWGNKPGGVWSPILQGLYQGMGPGGNLPPDHVQHLIAGLGITAGAEFTGNLFGMSEGQRNWLGFGLVAAGGLGREFYNETGFNLGDIGATLTVPGSFYLNRGLNGRNDPGYPGLSWPNMGLGVTSGAVGYYLYNQLEEPPGGGGGDEGFDGGDFGF